jgi:hypothetical protein
MASNPYYNYFTQTNEQDLMEDLVVESVKQYAHDVYYLPRDVNILDKLMTEPITQSFNHALSVECYVQNWSEMGGEGQLMAQFGLEIRDQMKFILTKRSHNQFILPTTGKSRPNEGDCIYIPMLKNVYQISYVSDSNPAFYILGKNYAWEVTCDLLEFNNEQFNTGVSVIDELNPPFEHLSDPDYELENYDKTAQNQFIQNESDEIIDWSEKSPFGEV